MAPGSGLRWVAQALLVWQWANHVATRGSGYDDPRCEAYFQKSTFDNTRYIGMRAGSAMRCSRRSRGF